MLMLVLMFLTPTKEEPCCRLFRIRIRQSVLALHRCFFSRKQSAVLLPIVENCKQFAFRGVGVKVKVNFDVDVVLVVLLAARATPLEKDVNPIIFLVVVVVAATVDMTITIVICFVYCTVYEL